MSTELAIKSAQESEFQVLQLVARNAAASGLYGGIGNESKIFMILLAANELGIKPMQALNGGMWNIQGKVELSARLMNSMIRRAGHSIKEIQCDNTKCILEGKRADNGDTFTASFTIEEAQQAGLAGRQNWKVYAKDMLFARALSRLARRLFPDIIGTAYVEGEIRDAKCEVIESIIEETPKENVEDAEAALQVFLGDHAVEDHEMIRSYFQKYAAHWKKGIMQSLSDYADKEKFLSDFGKWKKRQQDAKQ